MIKQKNLSKSQKR